MRMTRKPLLLLLCAVMLVVGSIMGTMAYLTDTEMVTNTFTVGSVVLGDGENEKGLDEAKTDVYGVEAEPAERVLENKYKLIPGHAYVKDPTVHVKNSSEDCYIFVKVENGIEAIEDSATTVAAQIAANGWLELSGAADLYYKEWTKNTALTDDETDDLVVFSQFKVSGMADNAAIESHASAEIVVTAYAVQADGFSSAAEAWGATFGAPADSDAQG